MWLLGVNDFPPNTRKPIEATLVLTTKITMGTQTITTIETITTKAAIATNIIKITVAKEMHRTWYNQLTKGIGFLESGEKY